MTRDEAIETWCTKGLTQSRRDLACVKAELAEKYLRDVAAADVDGFVALGILKLDEPKSIADMLSEAYAGYVSLTPSGLLTQLERVGLKIVEK